MKNITVLISILLISNCVLSQNTDYESIKSSVINLGQVDNNNEDFDEFSKLDSVFHNVEIVMLGEQSHGEATAYDTKVKLIKYLHQRLGFDLLVFESDFYACNKAWQIVEEGGNVRDAMGRSIFQIWSTTKDLIPLADYIEENHNSDTPLKLLGFDNQLTGKYSATHFINDLSAYLKTVKPSILDQTEWKHFSKSIELLTKYDFKGLKKNRPNNDLAFIQTIISELSKIRSDSESDFWLQTLRSIHSYLSDISQKTDFRDKQMAENLIWLKEKYPNSKIICWGATSHFLYNSEQVEMNSLAIQILGGNYYKKQPMMGEYIKEKFQEKVFTIGFTAYQGEYGLFRRGKIKVPKQGTLEFLLGQSEYDNFLLPLNHLNLDGYKSRPLGNYYMKNDIDEVMDAVIFNRNMRSPKLDRNFFLQIYPENKYIKPEIEE
ncbi:MAG: erythromycin esterase family protein [Bacteroidota bacterium]